MASVPVIPNPPTYLSTSGQKRWSATYQKALAQAKLDLPRNESAQRAAALKAANALLVVPAPTSAAEIDTLEEWQVMKRETRVIKGEVIRICVTTDGRKYKFPVVAEVGSKQQQQPVLGAKVDGANDPKDTK